MPEAAAGPGPAELSRAGGRPYVHIAEAAPMAEEQAIDLIGMIEGWRKGIIVVGPQDDPRLPNAVLELARRLRYPVLADPLSGLRCGVEPSGLVIDAYDDFLALNESGR